MKNKKLKKLVALVIASTMGLTALAGCGSTPSSESTKEESKSSATETPETSEASETPATDVKVKIGVSMSTTQNLFYSKMAQIIKDYCDEQGVECMVTDENNDINKQISSFENFVSSGCTAILAVAFDPDGISDMAKKATESGIYVMTYDGIVDGAEGSLNLDNYVYGYQTGKMAADWINSNPDLKAQEVVEVGVFDYPDIPLIIDRAKGIVDALTELAPNAKVVAQQKAGVGDEGNIQAENFLASHPNIQVICGINDTGVLGAYEVFKSQGNEGDNYGLFGADGDPQALQLISEGTMYRGTVMSGAYDALPGAIDILIAASRGEEVEGTIIYDTTPITIDNVQDYLEEE